MRRMEREGKVFYASGDHIGWFFDHAHHVRTCLALIAALNASEVFGRARAGPSGYSDILKRRARGHFPGPPLIPTLERTFQK